jgi:adenylylsulfate kinase
MIIWFTGQPGSGKTTLCDKLKNIFSSHEVFHIDGDDIRTIYENKDYSEFGRRRNVELAQNIAHFLHLNKKTVLVSLVSPYKEQREEFKSKLKDDILEIYVHTSEIRGREDYHVKDYDPPVDDFIDVDTTNRSIDECCELIIKKLPNMIYTTEKKVLVDNVGYETQLETSNVIGMNVCNLVISVPGVCNSTPPPKGIMFDSCANSCGDIYNQKNAM